jgi:hypothetical protein
VLSAEELALHAKPHGWVKRAFNSDKNRLAKCQQVGKFWLSEEELRPANMAQHGQWGGQGAYANQGFGGVEQAWGAMQQQQQPWGGVQQQQQQQQALRYMQQPMRVQPPQPFMQGDGYGLAYAPTPAPNGRGQYGGQYGGCQAPPNYNHHYYQGGYNGYNYGYN